MLLNAGCDIYESGNIRYHPGCQKYATSNVIGAAAIDDNNENIIHFVMGKTNDKSMLEFKAIETGGDPNISVC